MYCFVILLKNVEIWTWAARIFVPLEYLQIYASFEIIFLIKIYYLINYLILCISFFKECIGIRKEYQYIIDQRK